MSNGPSVDKVIETYITLRQQKEQVENETKDRVAALKEKMGKLESWIMAKSDETGVTSFKSPHGTAFLNTTDFASVADWDAVLGFIKDNDAYDMLERRVSRNAVRSYIDANGSVPAGVNFGTKVSVSFCKPTKKVE